MEKRAVFINRANELIQEFQFAHPFTKLKVNKIFNSSWNLLGSESVRLEKSWNVCMRIMLGIPRDSHRYCIEHLTRQKHIKFALLQRYMKFVESINVWKKDVLRNMLNEVMYDCRSNCGGNLRNIMLILGRSHLQDIKTKDLYDVKYIQTPETDKWKLNVADELLAVLNDELTIGMGKNMAKDILRDIVT